jgi:hypothetical protein
MASPVRYRLSAQLKFNIKAYLDREFVNSGLFINIGSGILYRPGGTRMDQLTRVNGTLYESFFNNWVYEPDATGVDSFPTTQASGVFIDGTFHARGSAPYEPEIDYNNGRVFFNGTEVPSSATVSAEFTYKNVGVESVDSQAVNRIFSNLKDSVDFTGNISAPSGKERQLPLCIIDPQKRLPRPRALGGAIEIDNLIVFHILANNTTELDQIVDILTETSFRKAFNAVDFNETPVLFTDNGDTAATFRDFTDMQGDVSLRLGPLYIDNAQLIEQFERFGVYYARVHWNAIIWERGAG